MVHKWDDERDFVLADIADIKTDVRETRDAVIRIETTLKAAKPAPAQPSMFQKLASSDLAKWVVILVMGLGFSVSNIQCGEGYSIGEIKKVSTHMEGTE